MSVSNGQPANASTFNNAFLSKTSNNIATGTQEFQNLVQLAKAFSMNKGDNSTLTGADQEVPFTQPFMELTNVSLTSINAIAISAINNAKSQIFFLKNSTGGSVTVKNDSGGTASHGILTGTGQDVLMLTGNTFIFLYDPTNSRWVLIGGGAGGGGSVPTGPFSVTQNSNADLSGELFSSTAYKQVDFVAQIIRGTTVFVRTEFSIFYRNGAWELAVGFDRYNANSGEHGVTWTVNTSTGQINAAVDNSGAGNATIKLQKILWPA